MAGTGGGNLFEVGTGTSNLTSEIISISLTSDQVSSAYATVRLVQFAAAGSGGTPIAAAHMAGDGFPPTLSVGGFQGRTTSGGIANVALIWHINILEGLEFVPPKDARPRMEAATGPVPFWGMDITVQPGTPASIDWDFTVVFRTI